MPYSELANWNGSLSSAGARQQQGSDGNQKTINVRALFQKESPVKSVNGYNTADTNNNSGNIPLKGILSSRGDGSRNSGNEVGVGGGDAERVGGSDVGVGYAFLGASGDGRDGVVVVDGRDSAMFMATPLTHQPHDATHTPHLPHPSSPHRPKLVPSPPHNLTPTQKPIISISRPLSPLTDISDADSDVPRGATLDTVHSSVGRVNTDFGVLVTPNARSAMERKEVEDMLGAALPSPWLAYPGDGGFAGGAGPSLSPIRTQAPRSPGLVKTTPTLQQSTQSIRNSITPTPSLSYTVSSSPSPHPPSQLEQPESPSSVLLSPSTIVTTHRPPLTITSAGSAHAAATAVKGGTPSAKTKAKSRSKDKSTVTSTKSTQAKSKGRSAMAGENAKTPKSAVVGAKRKRQQMDFVLLPRLTRPREEYTWMSDYLERNPGVLTEGKDKDKGKGKSMESTVPRSSPPPKSSAPQTKKYPMTAFERKFFLNASSSSGDNTGTGTSASAGGGTGGGGGRGKVDVEKGKGQLIRMVGEGMTLWGVGGVERLGVASAGPGPGTGTGMGFMGGYLMPPPDVFDYRAAGYLGPPPDTNSYVAGEDVGAAAGVGEEAGEDVDVDVDVGDGAGPSHSSSNWEWERSVVGRRARSLSIDERMEVEGRKRVKQAKMMKTKTTKPQDRPAEASSSTTTTRATTSTSTANPIRRRVVPKVKTMFFAEDEEERDGFCHHCRNRSQYQKMRCTTVIDGWACGLRYCARCIELHYPETEFIPFNTIFVCPLCDGSCTCSSCYRRRMDGKWTTPAQRASRGQKRKAEPPGVKQLQQSDRRNVGKEAKSWIAKKIEEREAKGRKRPRIFVGKFLDEWVGEHSGGSGAEDMTMSFEEMDAVDVDATGKGRGKAREPCMRIFIGKKPPPLRLLSASFPEYDAGEEEEGEVADHRDHHDHHDVEDHASIVPDETEPGLRRSRRPPKRSAKLIESMTVFGSHLSSSSDDEDYPKSKKRKISRVPEFTINHSESGTSSSPSQTLAPPDWVSGLGPIARMGDEGGVLAHGALRYGHCDPPMIDPAVLNLGVPPQLPAGIPTLWDNPPMPAAPQTGSLYDAMRPYPFQSSPTLFLHDVAGNHGAAVVGDIGAEKSDALGGFDVGVDYGFGYYGMEGPGGGDGTANAPTSLTLSRDDMTRAISAALAAART